MRERYEGKSDEDLLSEIFNRNGCGDIVFYLLYGRYAVSLESLFQRLYSNDLYADCFPDLMAEIELHLLEGDCHALRSYRGESSFKTWLLSVAHNLFINRLPKIEGVYHEKEEVANEHIPTSFSSSYADYEILAQFQHIINLLPSVEQRMVLLKEAEGYNSEEIAKLLTERRHSAELSPRMKSPIVSVDNVYKLRQRAIAYLKELIKAERQRIADEESDILFRGSDEETYYGEPAIVYHPHFIERILKIDVDLDS